MKRWLCLLLSALLCAAACAEEPAANEETAQKLKLDEAYAFDLDGDGVEETVQIRMGGMEDGENLQLQVETDEQIYTYDTYIMYEEAAYAVDLDGDGCCEILISGDEASADYFTWCLTFSREKGIQPIEFADANRGENTGEYFECGYGKIDAINGNVLTLSGTQDALGTWMFSRQFTLRDGRFELDDDGIWHTVEDLSDPENWEYRRLTLTKELDVAMEDGSSATLSAGTSLLITDTDKISFVGFQTEDGARGTFPIEPDLEAGWGFLVNGESEYDYFEYVPYAD